MTTLIVGGDSNVDEFSWGVSVAEADDGDVDVGGFFDGLGVGARIGDNDEARLFEGAGDVVGEITWREATGDSNGSCVCGEFEDGALTVGTSRYDTDVGRIVYGCDDAGCEDNFLPVDGYGSVDDLHFKRLVWSYDGRFVGALMVQWCSAKVAVLSKTYHVLPMLITLIPSGRVFHRYGSIWTCRFFEPI